MKRLLLLAAVLATPVFANPDDPGRDRVKALDPAFFDAVYVDAIRTMGCQVPFGDVAKRNEFFDLFLAQVYDEAKISSDSRRNNWLEGDALAQKDSAHFRLEDAGRVNFDDDTLILSLSDC